MKKVIKKIVLSGMVLMCLLHNLCFAVETTSKINTIADDAFQSSRKMVKNTESEAVNTSNYLPIIIGIAVGVIIVIAIIIIVKKKKELKTKND